MNNMYLKSGNVFYAVNLKAASSSIIRGIINTHYPNIEDTLQNNTSYPDGVSPDVGRWHSLLTKIDNPDGEIILIVRDPIDRFRSACAESNIIDIDELLSKIESDNNKDRHFYKTSNLVRNNVRLYRFDTDLELAATALGIDNPLVDISGNNRPKPDLTPEQISKIEEIYADDIILYESISVAGQVYLKSTPVSDADKILKIREISNSRYLAEISGVEVEPFGVIPTDRVTQSKLTSVYIKALNEPSYTKNWKVSETSWATLDSQKIITIGDAVENHIQAQFDREQILVEAILAASTKEELDLIAW